MESIKGESEMKTFKMALLATLLGVLIGTMSCHVYRAKSGKMIGLPDWDTAQQHLIKKQSPAGKPDKKPAINQPIKEAIKQVPVNDSTGHWLKLIYDQTVKNGQDVADIRHKIDTGLTRQRGYITQMDSLKAIILTQTPQIHKLKKDTARLAKQAYVSEATKVDAETGNYFIKIGVYLLGVLLLVGLGTMGLSLYIARDVRKKQKYA